MTSDAGPLTRPIVLRTLSSKLCTPMESRLIPACLRRATQEGVSSRGVVSSDISSILKAARRRSMNPNSSSMMTVGVPPPK